MSYIKKAQMCKGMLNTNGKEEITMTDSQETMIQSTFDNTYNQFTPDVFRNPLFGELRVFIDSRGEVWFVGYEVATKLGYSNPRKAISDHISPEYKMGSVTIRDGTSGGNPNINLIREKGVYELCMKSKLPDAKKFQDWVYSTIQSMRQYGSAMSQELQDVSGMSPQQLYEENSRLKEDLSAAQPAIHMYHQATNDDAIITAQQIADNYGWTAQKLNTELHNLGFHYSSGEGWVLYEKYKDKGLVKTIKRETKDGSMEFITGYTEKGRNLIDQLLHDNYYRTKFEIQSETDRRLQIANQRAMTNNMYNQPQPIYNNNYYNNNYFFGSNPDEIWNQIRQIPDTKVRVEAMKAFSNHIHEQSNSNCPLVDKYGNSF